MYCRRNGGTEWRGRGRGGILNMEKWDMREIKDTEGYKELW
jgi:hypothetical protein